MERINQPGILRDPQSVQELYGNYVSGRIKPTPGQIETIAHMLYPEAVKQYFEEHKSEPVDYSKLMQAKLSLYEPIMDRLSNIRDQVAQKVKEQKPDEVVDLAAGFAWIASRFQGLKYYAVDTSQPTREKGMERLSSLNIPVAGYHIHDLNNGFPTMLPEVGKDVNRVAFSLWGASYLRADKLVTLVRDAFDKGCSAFINVGVNPKHFKVDEILDSMIVNTRYKSDKEQAALTDIIKLAEPGAP